jgi:hypothetical protein
MRRVLCARFAARGRCDCAPVGDVATLACLQLPCHTRVTHNRAYDRLTTRQEKPLERTKRAFRSVSTSDDPIVR